MITVRKGNHAEWFGSNGEYKWFLYDNRMECGKDAVLDKLKQYKKLVINYCDFADDDRLLVRIALTDNPKDYDGYPIEVRKGVIDFKLSKTISQIVTRIECEAFVEELRKAYREATKVEILPV